MHPGEHPNISTAHDSTQQLALLEAELNALNYAVSHDLQAPVRAIAGFSRALHEYHAELNPEAQHFLAHIQQATQRLQAMIAALLELSRLSQTSLQCSNIDLSTLAQELHRELQARYPNHHPQFRIETSCQISADRRLLRTALLALLDNAWKFTQDTPQAQVTLRAKTTATTQELCVADNGSGFNIQHATRLGTPFQHFHPHNHLSGIGMGLATAQRVASKHGGQLRADSSLQQGSQFYLQLPITTCNPTHIPMPGQ